MRIIIYTSIIMVLLLIFTALSVLAAELEIPFRCYEKTLIAEFAKSGIILDKENENADGFIENKGSSYIIYIYNHPADWKPFTDIPLKVEREKNGNNL